MPSRRPIQKRPPIRTPSNAVSIASTGILGLTAIRRLFWRLLLQLDCGPPARIRMLKSLVVRHVYGAG
jgi:hypothetical protein